MQTLLSLLLACSAHTPTWPDNAALEVIVPEQAAEDGSYTATVLAPTALGRKQKDFDLYQLSFLSREPSETVELFDEAERPAYRSHGVVLKGDETITLVAASYGMKRPGVPLVVHVTAPPSRAPGAAPAATASSVDPLGRSDYFPLPMAASQATREALNAALRQPLSLRDYKGSPAVADTETDAQAAAALAMALQPCLVQFPVSEPTPATLSFHRAEGMTPSHSAKGLAPDLSACLVQAMEAFQGGQGVMLTLEMYAQPQAVED